MRAKKQLIETEKTEKKYTDEQRAHYCKWILDNGCWYQENYYNKFKHLMSGRGLPDLKGRMIVPNSFGGVNILDI